MAKKVVEVTYSRTVNTGNYNSERLEYRLSLEEGNVDEMIAEVRQLVSDKLRVNNPYRDEDKQYLNKVKTTQANMLCDPDEDEDEYPEPF